MENVSAWNGNWAWSLPLIVVTVIFHVIGLVLVNEKVIQGMRSLKTRYKFLFAFALVMGAGTLFAIVLHAVEAGLWAGMYWALDALPDGKSALLYSLGAMTTYGHEVFRLAEHWQLMGALEALDGMILFGLTTAFLYGMIREVLAERTPG
jgi:hypothetical protein